MPFKVIVEEKSKRSLIFCKLENFFIIGTSFVNKNDFMKLGMCILMKTTNLSTLFTINYSVSTQYGATVLTILK